MKPIEWNGAKAALVSSVSQYFYQLVGEETPLEAIWARLNSSEVRKRGWTNIEGISLLEGTKYKRFLQRLPCGLYEAVIVHPSALVTWPGVDFTIIATDGDEVPVGFYERLNARLRLPLLREWERYLWEAGLKTKTPGEYEWQRNVLIEKHEGENAVAWEVRASVVETWETIVTTAILIKN